MSANNNKFIAFVQAVGADFKALNQDKADKTELEQKFNQLNEVITGLQSRENGVTEQMVTQKITELKNELFGGELDETLDTLKEIGDKLKELSDDSTISGAITEKLTELRGLIDQVKKDNEIDDLVQIYNTAKL